MKEKMIAPYLFCMPLSLIYTWRTFVGIKLVESQQNLIF